MSRAREGAREARRGAATSPVYVTCCCPPRKRRVSAGFARASCSRAALPDPSTLQSPSCAGRGAARAWGGGCGVDGATAACGPARQGSDSGEWRNDARRAAEDPCAPGRRRVWEIERRGAALAHGNVTTCAVVRRRRAVVTYPPPRARALGAPWGCRLQDPNGRDMGRTPGRQAAWRGLQGVAGGGTGSDWGSVGRTGRAWQTEPRGLSQAVVRTQPRRHAAQASGCESDQRPPRETRTGRAAGAGCSRGHEGISVGHRGR